ncbi:MAG: U32 family peptidase [Methanobacterium paludis]|nr:U32 family peptidase [Methanobacterium paludis]
MRKNFLPELLAPAGSMEALKAAVNAGADAVYLSGKRFGARHYAANFEDEEIEGAVSYAHLHGVKVQVTVNTLIKDSELQDVAEYLLWLYKIGVDAVIIQDLGVASICREMVPNLDMHASTQMTIHNFEGVKWAAEFGFKRVVLAREVGVQDIKRISEKLNEELKADKSSSIELEVFGHGALCYSYSGQCLMSSFIGGRSGNRGMCAQPCRKPYDFIVGEKDEFGRPQNTRVMPLKEHYLLSTRDLSVYKHLNQISKAHVNSIKIEGRMRSPQYVAIVVGIYRKAIDSMKREKWKPTDEDVSKLKLAFNRGFTEGYMMNARRGSLMARDGPSNRGLYVGDVVGYKKSGEVVVKIKNPIIPQKGDGIVFKSLNQDERDQGMFLEKEPSMNKCDPPSTLQLLLEYTGKPLIP